MLRTQDAPAQARAGASFRADSDAALRALLSPAAFPTFGDVHGAAGLADSLIGRQWTYDERRLRPVPGMPVPVSLPVSDRYVFQISGGTLSLKHQRGMSFREVEPWHSTTTHRTNVLCSCAYCVEVEGGDDEGEASPAGVITHWSRRSRARMVRALAEVDHGAWESSDAFAMVTLTLPGDWLTVAPTGSVFKGYLRALARRFERATGRKWQACWKLEFQRRGAPHFHLLMRPPAVVAGRRFEAWLSSTWADVVAHPDPVQRMLHESAGTNVDYGYNTTDPKRVAVYFYKHASKTADSKEYQHNVPSAWAVPGAGPGRFWGITGLSSLRAVVDVDGHTFYRVRRILRDLERANRARTALARRRHALAAGEWDGAPVERRESLERLGRFGMVRSRLMRSSNGGGWVLLNDAPRVAVQLAAFLELDANTPPPRL